MMLLTLIVGCVLLLALFVGGLVMALLKKSRSMLVFSCVIFLLLSALSAYTIYTGLKTGKKTAIKLAQRILPPFDSDQPDTEANRKNFRNFFHIDLTPDVKNIYCFDDAIGADADYMFSFNCDSNTVKRIIEQNGLRLDTADRINPEGLQHDFFWWNKDRIRELRPYSWKHDEKEYYKLFWYDAGAGKAYYFEYTL